MAATTSSRDDTEATERLSTAISKAERAWREFCAAMTDVEDSWRSVPPLDLSSFSEQEVAEFEACLAKLWAAAQVRKLACQQIGPTLKHLRENLDRAYCAWLGMERPNERRSTSSNLLWWQ